MLNQDQKKSAWIFGDRLRAMVGRGFVSMKSVAMIAWSGLLRLGHGVPEAGGAVGGDHFLPGVEGRGPAPEEAL